MTARFLLLSEDKQNVDVEGDEDEIREQKETECLCTTRLQVNVIE